jgi:WD40 repeat protein
MLSAAVLAAVGGGWPSHVRAQASAAERLTFSEAPRLITRAGDRAQPATVLALAVSPDGKLLALAGEDPVIALHDMASNQARAALSGHTEPVTCVAFSPDGKALASSGFDRTVRLWDLTAMAERTALAGHTSWVLAVAFSPDGRLLASAGDDKTIVLWDVADGRKLAALEGHAGPVRALAFAPDGATLASAGSDRAVRFWNVSARAPRASWDRHEGAVRALAFSPDGRMLATASEDHTVRLWDVATGQVRTTHGDNTDMVLTLAFAPKGNALVSGAYDGQVRVWSPPDEKSAVVLRSHQEGVTALAFDPANGSLLTAGYDRAVKLWTPGVPVARLEKSLPPSPGRNAEAQFSPDGRRLLTTELAAPGVGAAVRIWDTSTWQQRGSLAEDDGATLYGHYSTDGRVIMTTSRRAVRIWDAERLTPLLTFASAGRQALPSAVAPDSSQVAYIDDQGAVVLRELPPRGASEAERAALEQQAPKVLIAADADRFIQQLYFAPSGKELIVTSIATNGVVRATAALYGVADGRELWRTDVPGCNFARTFLSPDGKTAAGVFSNQVEGGDSTLVFWARATWHELARIQVPSSAPTALAFSPDGARVVLASRQGVVYLWDARTRRPIGQFSAHDGIVVSVYFSPDGRRLATASTVPGEPVKIWELDKTRSSH